MSPVSILDVLIITLILGWPGLLVGACLGYAGSTQHRAWRATWLGLGGLILCIVLRLLPW